MVNSQRRLALPNPHLMENEEDYLYHLGLTTHDNLPELFRDVKVRTQPGYFGECGRAAVNLVRLFEPRTYRKLLDLLTLPSSPFLVDPCLINITVVLTVFSVEQSF